MKHSIPATHYPLLVIVGPTASGKSELAVKLAKRFHGEIISADSRQIYKGMDIGTGKVTGRWTTPSHPKRSKEYLKPIFIYKSIPHHLIDFQNPKYQYSVARFQKDAKKIITDITKRKKLPIICGGSMHWIDAVVYNQNLPEVKASPKLRAKLEKQSVTVLFNRLSRLDPVRASNIDKFNKRRIIRALEIVITTGKPVPLLTTRNSQLKTLFIGITLPQQSLYKKIDLRLKQRLKQGMLKEVNKLHKNGLSWKRIQEFGLEYKSCALYLQKKITYDEMLMQLSYAIKHYSKRQLTWWERNQEIVWIKPDIKKAITLTKRFLN